MNTASSRREFLAQTLTAATGLGLLPACTTINSSGGGSKNWFEISLAEWSLHVAIRDEKRLTHLEFPKVARREFNLGAVEHVNQMFMDKATDKAYLAELKRTCDGEGVRSVLIMCDREGNLGDPDAKKRDTAVGNHHKWADAAKFLGCHSIRVNAATGNTGSYAEQQERAADGLRKLSEYCASLKLNCIVENHGGLSSNGAWLASVMRRVGLPNCGTLPDFGNFHIDKATGEQYDRYLGTTELMPFAKGVSAKTYDFDAAGNETTIDYPRIMKIVKDSGYRSFVGIEYEGKTLPEYDGIHATIRLLERTRAALA